MLHIPLVIIYAIIAFNITAFTVLLHLDFLIIRSIEAKAFFTMLTIAAWVVTYINRKKSIKLKLF